MEERFSLLMLTDSKRAHKKRPVLSWIVVAVPVLAAGGLIWAGGRHVAKPTVSIFDAARTQDNKDVQLLVEAGTSPNALSSSGHTALFFAAQNGDLKTVEFLLKSGASPNAEGPGKSTALDAAALSGNLAIVEDLLNAGARLDTPTIDNQTPLHAAATGGNKDVMLLLLKRGLDPNARRNTDHATPLAEAASSGSLECLEVLAQHGSSLDTPGYRQRTPIMLAILVRHTDVAKKLVSLGADLTKYDDVGTSALTFAMLEGEFDVAEQIINKLSYQDLRAYDPNGNNALYYAVQLNAPFSMDEELIRRGCSVKQKAKNSFPLTIAADRGNQPLVDLLKHAG